MEFCNLIGDSTTSVFERSLNGRKGIPLRIDTPEALEPYGIANNVWIQSTGTEVVIRHADEAGNGAIVENNLFAMTGNRDEEVMPFYKRKDEAPILWADVQDTPENPAIIVMCKSLYLVSGVKTYIKVLQVNKDCIVAMLVAGAIGFEDDQQQIITMSRNLPEGMSLNGRRDKRLSPKDLDGMMLLQDSNGYCYNMDTAISAYVHATTDMTTVRVMRDACPVIDPQASVRAQALADAKAEKARKEEERKAKEREEAEEARKRQAAEAARRKEVARIQEEARREAAKAKAAATRAAKKAERTEIQTPEGSSRNAGAEFFLAMLNKAEEN